MYVASWLLSLALEAWNATVVTSREIDLVSLLLVHVSLILLSGSAIR
jgi:hypothetical protein